MTIRVRHLQPDQSPPLRLGTVVLTEAGGVREVNVVTDEGLCTALVSNLTLGGDFERALAFARDLAEATGAGTIYVRGDQEVGRSEPKQQVAA